MSVCSLLEMISRILIAQTEWRCFEVVQGAYARSPTKFLLLLVGTPETVRMKLYFNGTSAHPPNGTGQKSQNVVVYLNSCSEGVYYGFRKRFVRI